MNSRNKIWITLSIVLVGAVTLACSCNALSALTATPTPPPTPTSPPAPTPIPMQGLEGSWEDPETGTVHTIVWNGFEYEVVSAINANRGEYPVTEQSWDGESLFWTYYVASTGVSVSFQTISVTSGQLYTNWWNSSDASGTETLNRVAGPPAVTAPSTAGEPMPGLAGVWRDVAEGTVHTIEWTGSTYTVVRSVNDERGTYSVTEEDWDGSTFTWTYYVPQTDVSVTIEATSVSGNIMYLNWWSSNGNSGTDTFTRE